MSCLRSLGLALALALCGCSAGTGCPTGTKTVTGSLGGTRTQWCARPDGIREGPYRMTAGRVTVYGEYRNGLKDGLWIHREGNNLAGFIMDHGTGVEMSWFPGFWKRREQVFRRGVADGPATEWFPSGKIKSIEHWRDGKKTGQWFEYDVDGNLVATRVYKDDHLISEERERDG